VVSGELSAPLSVLVPERQFSATFTVTAGSTAGSAQVEATLGGTTVSSTIDVVEAPPVGLLLVEVLYDVTDNDDTKEWIKLYNGTGTTLDLSGYSLGWGGTDYTYGTLPLSGTVQAGECFTVGGPTSDSTNGNPTLDQAVDLSPDVQNSGSTADGVALFDVPAASITSTTWPIDNVVYGGSNSNNLIGPSGSPSVVHAPDVSADNSLVRTDQTTWAVNSTPNDVACVVIP
jgi:hypothetical protein